MHGQDPRYWSPAKGICKGLEGKEHKFEELTVSSSARLEQGDCESV